jgi:uncharacterized protein YndB with AHSA1/START domain
MKNKLVGSVSSRIDAPATKVWEALTKPTLIKQYFFGTKVRTDWKPGSAIIFTGEWNGKSYEDKGTIVDAQPFKVLKYKYWSSMSGAADVPENYANITYELSDEDGETMLTVLQDNIPDEKTKTHSEANWKTVLDNLKHLLEKKLA